MSVEKLKQKLGGRAGESIAETLISLLIAALALVMLAGAITTAHAVIRTSKAKLNEYYVAAENVAKRKTAESGLTEPKVTIAAAPTDTEVYISVEAPVAFYRNGVFDGTPVIAYHYVDDETP